MTEPTAWKPGDRVEVRLPDKNGLRGRVNAHNWFPGTVRDIDTGSGPGVLVDLDSAVNGLSDCYATHAELRPEGAERLWCWCCAQWGLTVPAIEARHRKCAACLDSTPAECKARHMAKALALTPDDVRLGW